MQNIAKYEMNHKCSWSSKFSVTGTIFYMVHMTYKRQWLKKILRDDRNPEAYVSRI